MDKIIALLKERNRNLARFSALNGAEIQKLCDGNFDSIDDFYTTREGLLDIIKHVEAMIDRRLQVLGDFTNVNMSIKRMVSGLLKERDEIVSQILNQDLEILSYIDQAKDSIIQELQTLKRNRKVIGSYKSGGRKNLIDEEA